MFYSQITFLLNIKHYTLGYYEVYAEPRGSMCMCIHVFVGGVCVYYIYMHIYVYASFSIYIHMHIYAYTYIHAYICIYICMYKNIWKMIQKLGNWFFFLIAEFTAYLEILQSGSDLCKRLKINLSLCFCAFNLFSCFSHWMND